MTGAGRAQQNGTWRPAAQPVYCQGGRPSSTSAQTSARAAPQNSYTVSLCVLFSVTLSPTAIPPFFIMLILSMILSVTHYHFLSPTDSLCHLLLLTPTTTSPLPPSHPRLLSPSLSLTVASLSKFIFHFAGRSLRSGSHCPHPPSSHPAPPSASFQRSKDAEDRQWPHGL